MQAELSELGDFFQQLQQRRRQIGRPELLDGQAARALVLANAALRVARLREQEWPLPAQLAVIGPTQSGKSTLVNLLLGQACAVASPLAGFTRHAQGFLAPERIASVERTIGDALLGWRQGVPAEQGEQQGVFQLLPVDGGPDFSPRPTLLWDTPDFDSVGSRSYRDSVSEICALADALFLVVSREKYADRSVWELLRLLAPLRRPLMVCLNKVAPDEAAALTTALQRRLAQERIVAADTLILPYVGGAGAALAASAEAAALRTSVAEFLEAAVQPPDPAPLYDLLHRNWQEWSAPLRGELAAIDYWREAVDAGLGEALAAYQRDSLENPRYSYALQRAVVHLLELLEIPGLAGTLTRVRSVLTWPARKLQGLLGSQLPLAANKQDQEHHLLHAAVAHLLLELQHRASEQLPVGSGLNQLWWRELLTHLMQRRTGIGVDADAAIERYLQEFEGEIEQASQRLYTHLQRHPATLNGLRAARATTDAAAVAVAIKTGGIGISDLFLTPALLAFTSLLAEGAVGGYMKQVEAELQAQQTKLVEATLFEGVLRPQLRELPAELAANSRFGVDARALARIDALLEEVV